MNSREFNSLLFRCDERDEDGAEPMSKDDYERERGGRGQFDDDDEDDDFDFPLDNLSELKESDKYRVNVYNIYLCVSRHLHCSDEGREDDGVEQEGTDRETKINKTWWNSYTPEFSNSSNSR